MNHEKLAPLEYIVSPIFTKHLATLTHVRGRVMKVLKSAKQGLNQSQLEENYFKRYLKTLEFPIQKITGNLISKKEIITEGTGEEMIFFHGSYSSTKDELESNSDSKSEVTQKYVPRVDVSIMRQSRMSTDQSSSIIGNLLKKIDEKSRPISKSVIRVKEILPPHKEGKEDHCSDGTHNSSIPTERKVIQRSSLTTDQSTVPHQSIVESLLRKIDSKNQSISKNKIQVQESHNKEICQKFGVSPSGNKGHLKLLPSDDCLISQPALPSTPLSSHDFSLNFEAEGSLASQTISSMFHKQDLREVPDRRESSSSVSGEDEDEDETLTNFEVEFAEMTSPVQDKAAANKNSIELHAMIFPSPENKADHKLESALQKQEENHQCNSLSSVSNADDREYVEPDSCHKLSSQSALLLAPLNEQAKPHRNIEVNCINNNDSASVIELSYPNLLEPADEFPNPKSKGVWIQPPHGSLVQGPDPHLDKILNKIFKKREDNVREPPSLKLNDQTPKQLDLSFAAAVCEDPMKRIVERVVQLLQEAGSNGLDVSGIERRFLEKYDEKLEGLRDCNGKMIKIRQFLSDQKEIRRMERTGRTARMYCYNFDGSSQSALSCHSTCIDSTFQRVEEVNLSTAATTSSTSLSHRLPPENDILLINWPFDADHLKHIPGRLAALLKEIGEKIKVAKIRSRYLQKYGESLNGLRDRKGRKIKLKTLLLCHKEIEKFGTGKNKLFRYNPSVSPLSFEVQSTSNVASSFPLTGPMNAPMSMDIPAVQLNDRNAAMDELTPVPGTASNSAVVTAPPIMLPTSTMGNGDLGEESCLLSFSISKNSFVRMNKGFSGNILANQRYTALDIEGFNERDRDYSLAQMSLGDGNSAILFDHQQGKEAVHRTLLNSFLNAKDLQYIFIHDCYQDVIALSSSFVNELYRNSKCFIDTQLVYEYFHHNFHCGFYSCLDFFTPNKEKPKMKDVVKDDSTYWLRRPLTLEQVQYAALDVILLQRAIPAILNKIKVAGEAAELDLLSVFLHATEKRITNVFEGLNRTLVFDNDAFRPVSKELAEALSDFCPNSKYSRMVRKMDHPSLFPVDNLSSAVPSKAISDSHERFNAAQIQITKLEQTNSKLTSELHSKNQECERLTAQLRSVLQRLAEAESKTNNSDHYHLKLKTEEFAIKMNEIEHEVQELQKLRKADLNQFFINISQIEDAINTIKCNNSNVNDDKGDVGKLRPEEIQEVFHLQKALRNFIGSLKVQLKQKYDVIAMTSQKFKPLETVKTATVPLNVSGGNGVTNYYAFNALPGTLMLPHAAPAPSVQWYVPYNPAQVQVNPEFCALPGCRNLGLHTCTGCKKLSYCSVDHQR